MRLAQGQVRAVLAGGAAQHGRTDRASQGDAGDDADEEDRYRHAAPRGTVTELKKSSSSRRKPGSNLTFIIGGEIEMDFGLISPSAVERRRDDISHMSTPTQRACLFRRFSVLALLALLAGCATPPKKPMRPREEVRAQLATLIPSGAQDRAGWALDISDAFYALDVEPSASHLCAALAVIEQESSFVADPPAPSLGRLAQEDIDRRAGAHHIPAFAVHAAM